MSSNEAHKVLVPVWRANQFFLCRADARQEGAGRELLFVNVELPHALFHQRHLVGVVVHNKVAVQADLLAELAQQAGAQGMKRADPQMLADVIADELADALLHLLRGLVGEGHGQNVARRDIALGDEIGDAMRKNARFARPRARKQQQRPGSMQHGLPLYGVQALQQGMIGISGAGLVLNFGKGKGRAQHKLVPALVGRRIIGQIGKLLGFGRRVGFGREGHGFGHIGHGACSLLSYYYT